LKARRGSLSVPRRQRRIPFPKSHRRRMATDGRTPHSSRSTSPRFARGSGNSRTHTLTSRRLHLSAADHSYRIPMFALSGALVTSPPQEAHRFYPPVTGDARLEKAMRLRRRERQSEVPLISRSHTPDRKNCEAQSETESPKAAAKARSGGECKCPACGRSQR